MGGPLQWEEVQIEMRGLWQLCSQQVKETSGVPHQLYGCGEQRVAYAEGQKDKQYLKVKVMMLQSMLAPCLSWQPKELPDDEHHESWHEADDECQYDGTHGSIPNIAHHWVLDHDVIERRDDMAQIVQVCYQGGHHHKRKVGQENQHDEERANESSLALVVSIL